MYESLQTFCLFVFFKFKKKKLLSKLIDFVKNLSIFLFKMSDPSEEVKPQYSYNSKHNYNFLNMM